MHRAYQNCSAVQFLCGLSSLSRVAMAICNVLSGMLCSLSNRTSKPNPFFQHAQTVSVLQRFLPNKNYTGIVQMWPCWTAHRHKIIISIISCIKLMTRRLDWSTTFAQYDLPEISWRDLQYKQLQRHNYESTPTITEINILYYFIASHIRAPGDSGEHAELFKGKLQVQKPKTNM